MGDRRGRLSFRFRLWGKSHCGSQTPASGHDPETAAVRFGESSWTRHDRGGDDAFGGAGRGVP